MPLNLSVNRCHQNIGTSITSDIALSKSVIGDSEYSEGNIVFVDFGFSFACRRAERSIVNESVYF